MALKWDKLTKKEQKRLLKLTLKFIEAVNEMKYLCDEDILIENVDEII